ncbi:hypothetical protein JOD54_002463 [Actinokineospora baliensis]|uniref:hypothetical protein n=1 Tax=Actinokineospora baliensis TaxID=547056 RepID=UPI00195F064A|nr:hypothetical protein [Actinokineospora baliensis]MBM7772259.1 hypothetical protein [Actinokineospora baliensis]
MSRAFGALVLFESRLLLRSPVLVPLAVVMLAARTFTTWQQMPNWSIDTVDTATAAVIVGAGALLSANLAALRDAKGGFAELLTPVPSQPVVRTMAVLAAATVVSALLSTAVIAVHVASLRIGSVPVGRFDLAELAAGVVVVVLMAALGVALARWVPVLVAAPVALLVLVWSMFQFPGVWLLPVVPDLKVSVDPVRPPLWHLLYAAGLVVIALAVALLRHGPRPARLGVAVLGVVAAVLGGVLTLGSPQAGAPTASAGRGWADREVTSGAEHCTDLSGVRYCSFPTFAAWIPLWQEAIDPVVSAVPPGARDDLPRVVQRTLSGRIDAASARSTIMPDTSWGRNGGEVDSRRALAAQMAGALTGFPPVTEIQTMRGCDGRDRSRTVVALWLINQVEPAAAPERGSSQGDGGEYSAGRAKSDLGAVDYSDTELGYATRLRATPDAKTRIWSNWDELVDPDTTLARALPLLGLTADLPLQRSEGEPCR